MRGTGRLLTGKRMALVALVLVAGLGGCNRNKFPITPCIGDYPAVERTKDVAPPNCPDS